MRAVETIEIELLNVRDRITKMWHNAVAANMRGDDDQSNYFSNEVNRCFDKKKKLQEELKMAVQVVRVVQPTTQVARQVPSKLACRVPKKTLNIRKLRQRYRKRVLPVQGRLIGKRTR